MNYDLDYIIILKKKHSCKLDNRWKIIRMGADIRIKCLGCGRTVLLPRSEFEKRIKTILPYKPEPINPTYKSLKNEKNRFNIQRIGYESITKIPGNLLFNLQLIDSANNHVSRRHKIENRTVRIAYRLSPKCFIILDYKCHYCKDCHVYFDFYQSFIQQLQYMNLRPDHLVLKLRKNYNTDYITRLQVGLPIYYCFNDESLLHFFGYRVGSYGLNIRERQELLKSIYERKALTISEMKATINNNIRMFSKRSDFAIAVEEWKDDILFLNTLI